MFSQESDIVKTMRLVEGLKAALILDLGELYRAMAAGGGRIRKDLLAKLIVNCYVLGKRLGVEFSDMDEAVRQRSQCSAQEESALESRFGDYSRLSRYLEHKR